MGVADEGGGGASVHMHDLAPGFAMLRPCAADPPAHPLRWRKVRIEAPAGAPSNPPRPPRHRLPKQKSSPPMRPCGCHVQVLGPQAPMRWPKCGPELISWRPTSTAGP